MRKLLIYLKEKRRALVFVLLLLVIFSATVLLYGLPTEAVIYPVGLCLLIAAVFFWIDYLRDKRKQEELVRLITLTAEQIETLPEADTASEQAYQSILQSLKSEIVRSRAAAQNDYRDMVDYYTVWAHQIKTPIASMKLTLQNEDSDRARKLSAELFRIEQYVDMVLAFLRLGSEQTDYVFRRCALDDILCPSLKKFAGEFIGRKLTLAYTPIAASVITDEKWLSFVLEQLLSNALKYTRSGSIAVFLRENELCIRDTGIGIAPEDLPRIFEKGYTGFNGRLDRTASGLGLYLCRRVCDNLNIRITVTSEIGQGTEVRLNFAENGLTKQ